MEYLTITDVPEVIEDFYFEDTVSEPTGEMVEETYTDMGYDDEGNEAGEVEATRQVPGYHDVIYVRQVSRPETKAIGDLERLIALGKPTYVTDKFAPMVAVGYQWAWFDLYTSYQEELASHLEAKEAFEPVTDEESGTTTEFTEVEPTEPVRPLVQTGEDILKPYLRELFKKSRAELVAKITVEVDGMVFDGDEKAQGRMTRAALVLDEGETTLWVLTNNDPVEVTKAQFLTALKLAGQAQSDMWV